MVKCGGLMRSQQSRTTLKQSCLVATDLSGVTVTPISVYPANVSETISAIENYPTSWSFGQTKAYTGGVILKD